MEIISSLNRIADSLQIPLKYDNKTISGEGTATLELLPGLNMPLHIKALKLFVSDSCGVLFKIKGNLYMVVSHFTPTDSMTSFIIAGNDRMGLDLQNRIDTGMSLREVISELRSDIKASFNYSKGSTKWSPLKLPTIIPTL